MVKVFAVADSTYFILDNKVYSVGNNEYGQLGLGDELDRNTPVPIDFLENKNISKIIGGYGHAFAITENGDIYSVGFNRDGQLGLGHNNSPQFNFSKNETLSNFNSKDIKAGYNHNLLVKNGKLYAWGYNEYGQLGLGDTTNRNTPTEVVFFSDKNIIIKNAYTGYYNSFVTTTNNRLYVWGDNFFDQLGIKNRDYKSNPTELIFFRDVPIKDIKTNTNATFILTESGKVYSFGYNGYGQLGLGHNLNRSTPQLIKIDNKLVDKIITGRESTIATTSDGSIYGWGYNARSELGVRGITSTPKRLIQIEALNSIDIQMGKYHTIIKTQNEEIYVLGRNDFGQLGLGHLNPIYSPTKLNLSSFIQ